MSFQIICGEFSSINEVRQKKPVPAPKDHTRTPICTVKFRNIKPQISTSGAKICIVDDDTPVLRSLKELIASDDLDMETFDDPEKFLDCARDHVIRLALLDLWMPTHSGIEVQGQLHRLSPIFQFHLKQGNRLLLSILYAESRSDYFHISVLKKVIKCQTIKKPKRL